MRSTMTGVAALAAAVMIPLSVSAQVPSPLTKSFRQKAPLHKALSTKSMGQFLTGSVASVNGSNFTVTAKNGTSYTVDAGGAKFTFGLTASNVLVGDQVVVMGAKNGTQVTATMVQDLSFLGRNLFLGKVESVSGSTITLSAQGMKKTTSTNYTVDASNATITKRSMGMPGSGTSTSMTVADIHVGDHLMVIGTASGTSVSATSITDQPVIMPKDRSLFYGTVTAASGTALTITAPETKMSSSTTYTIDASAATLMAGNCMKGNASSSSSTLADIKVGDSITVAGTLSGSTITATKIWDMYQANMMQGKRKMMMR
jgi:hypothetical protein